MLRRRRSTSGCWFWGRPSNDQLWADIGEVLARTKADFDPTTAAALMEQQAAQATAAAAA